MNAAPTVSVQRRAGTVALDGKSVFLYRGDGGEIDVDFGVGVAAPFEAAGAVRYTELPTGPVATATRWEIYGHWSPDAPPRADVYYLLAE